MCEQTALIFDIKRFAIHDGDGLRTTVLFKGCPLHCAWCHNPEGISRAQEIQYVDTKCVACRECIRVCPTGAHRFIERKHVFDRRLCVVCPACSNACLGNALILCGRTMRVSEVLNVVLEDEVFYKPAGGVTLSGGECLLQADFCSELLKRLKRKDISTAVDTCGNVPQKELDKVLPYTDVFLYDIKHINPRIHQQYTGSTNELILKNLCYLNTKKARIEIRIPIIPTINDDEETITRIGELLSQYKAIEKVRILAYNNLAGSKYELLGKVNTMPKQQPPALSRMDEIRKTLSSYGLEMV